MRVRRQGWTSAVHCSLASRSQVLVGIVLSVMKWKIRWGDLRSVSRATLQKGVGRSVSIGVIRVFCFKERQRASELLPNGSITWESRRRLGEETAGTRPDLSQLAFPHATNPAATWTQYPTDKCCLIGLFNRLPIKPSLDVDSDYKMPILGRLKTFCRFSPSSVSFILNYLDQGLVLSSMILQLKF